MLSPIENGRRLLTNITSRKKTLVKGAMIVGGTAATFSGLGGFKTQRVDAQDSTPTPTATETINPIEPTLAPNQVLLKNPNTGECVLVVFPNQNINPEINPTPTPDANGQPISAIAKPTNEPVPTPDLIAQAPGVDSVNTAPLLQPQDDPTAWEPCAEGEEPTATMTAKPTVAPTEVPTSTPTVEPIPTPTVTPTAQPTAAPTPEPTSVPSNPPSNRPSPEATPKPATVEDWLDGDYPNKEGDAIDGIIENLFAAAPEAADVSWFGTPYSQAITQAWKVCKNGSTAGGNKDFNRKGSCIVTAGGIFKGFSKEEPKLARKAFEAVVGFAQEILPNPYKKDLVREIKENF